jgi:hypothetical protein
LLLKNLNQGLSLYGFVITDVVVLVLFRINSQCPSPDGRENPPDFSSGDYFTMLLFPSEFSELCFGMTAGNSSLKNAAIKLQKNYKIR